MTRVRVASFSISLDGYGAGPNQDIDDPLGVGGGALAQWLTPTRTFQRSLFGMEGDTTFHLITGGIREALDRAREAAGALDVRIGGGPSTIQQDLRAGLIDELHIAIAPMLLGAGERLFEGVDARASGFERIQFTASENAAHVVLRRRDA